MVTCERHQILNVYFRSDILQEGIINLLDQMSLLFCLLQGLIFRLLDFKNTVEGDTFTDINILYGQHTHITPLSIVMWGHMATCS